MKRYFLIMMGTYLLSGLTGCVHHSGLKPIYPKPNTAACFTPVKVDSLQPTFKWEMPHPSQNVDLIVRKAFVYSKSIIRQEVVFYKTNIAGGAYHIDKPLEPDTTYSWSIRPTGTGRWSVANHYTVLADFPHVDFLFKTAK